MNKRNLALLISKHPLLRKLTEDKTIPNSVVARLIVEELMEAQTKLLRNALAGIRRDFRENKQEKYINPETKQAVYPYGRLSELDEQEQEKYKDTVNKKVQAFLAQQNPETKAKGEELEKQVDAAIDKEINISQTPQIITQELIPDIAKVIINADQTDAFVSTYNQNDLPLTLGFITNKLPKEQVDVLKTASPEVQQKVVKAVADELEDNIQQKKEPQEPGKEEEPPSTTDPEKFDVDPELLNSLIAASEVFIDEFYEKAFLKDQGILVKNVLAVLATIVEKEELEKAARRISKPEETLEEQEEQLRQDPVKLRNIQVDLKSFIKLVKRSKDVLKTFDEFRAKGKVVGSSYKEKFMNILKQLQKNIKALVRDISSLNLISEKKDVSKTENKWSAIEKGYNEASRSLSNIIAAGAEDIESFDMEKNVNDAYTSLMNISGFFPSVNPFGAKTTKFDEYNELYTAAVKDIKSTIRDTLELAKGEGGSNTANNTIESLKEFSGQIQSIFGIPSKFEDVQIKPNEPAAEGDPEKIAVADLFARKGLLKLPPSNKVTDDQKSQLKDIEKQADEEIIQKAAQVFVGVKSPEAINLSPVEKTIAATEVKELANELEKPSTKALQIFNRYMGSRVPESFGLDDEQKDALRFFKYFQSKQENINEQDEGTVVGNKIAQDRPLLAIVNRFLDEHLHFTDTWNSIMQKTNAYDNKVTKEFLKYLKEPIEFSRARVPAERRQKNKADDDTSGLSSFIAKKTNELEEENLSVKKTAENIITAASKEYPLSSITPEDIKEIEKTFKKKEDSYKNRSLLTRLKDYLTNDDFIKKLDLANAKAVKGAIVRASDITKIPEIEDRLSALPRSPLRGQIANLFGKKFVDLSNKYLGRNLTKNEKNEKILSYIAYGYHGPTRVDGYDEVVSKAFKELRKFENDNMQEHLTNKLKPLIKEMLTKGK